MVKIKDNVNKIELESFLLEKGFYQMNGQWRKFGHFKISKNGHIIPLNGSGSRRFDIIYEMTEKGFIERIEENEK